MSHHKCRGFNSVETSNNLETIIKLTKHLNGPLRQDRFGLFTFDTQSTNTVSELLPVPWTPS